MTQSLAHYLLLPWKIDLKPDDTGQWVARITQLAGCTVTSADRQEALHLLEDAKRAWLQDALAHGKPIPVPCLVCE